MFGDTNNYCEATTVDKRKNFFMVQRRMAIQHPMQAHAFNGTGINQEAALDVWYKFLQKQYKKTPFWMYTKGLKKAKEEKEKKINIPAATIIEFAKENTYDLKSVYEALEMFPREMTKEIKEFEKLNK